MKIASFNVNGVKGRLSVLLRWLESARPDIVCLQELKSPDERFPIQEIEQAGYGAIWHGQKSWNGVAILAKGNAQRTARGSRRRQQPLHRSGCGRNPGGLPLPAQRQSGSGPEIRLQAEVA
jgi:exodeoxyribonuclease-3